MEEPSFAGLAEGLERTRWVRGRAGLPGCSGEVAGSLRGCPGRCPPAPVRGWGCPRPEPTPCPSSR